MGKLLGHDDILSKATMLKRELVKIPEWGDEKVWVQELTAAARDDYEQSMMDAHKVGKSYEFRPNLRNAKARMAVRVLVNEKGERLFKDNEADTLGRVSAAVLNRIVDVASRLSGMTKEDIEQLEQNFEKTPADGSPIS